MQCHHTWRISMARLGGWSLSLLHLGQQPVLISSFSFYSSPILPSHSSLSADNYRTMSPKCLPVHSTSMATNFWLSCIPPPRHPSAHSSNSLLKNNTQTEKYSTSINIYFQNTHQLSLSQLKNTVKDNCLSLCFTKENLLSIYINLGTVSPST